MKTFSKFLSFFLCVFFSVSVYAQNNSVTDSIEKMFDGTILSRNGKTVTVKISDQRVLPAIGQAGILSKYFEEEIFGMKTTGWLDIAKMTIASVKPVSVTMTINEELSEVIKDGKKVDHFKPGKTVHFLWKIKTGNSK